MSHKKTISLNGSNYTQEEVNDRIIEVDSYIERNRFSRKVHRLLKVISLASAKYRLRINKIDESSYTDGTNIVLSLPKYAIFLPFEKLYSVFIALAMHEMEHVLSTSNKLAKEYRTDVYEDIFRKRNIPKSISNKISHHIFNAIEDGRIERRAANRSPGTANILKWFRQMHWFNNILNKEGMNQGDFELEAVLWAVCCQATIGMFPVNWYDLFDEDSKETKLVKECIPAINEAVESEICQVCLNKSYEVCRILADFIADRVPDEDVLKQMLENFQSSVDNQANEDSEETEEDGNSVGNSISIRQDNTDSNDKEEEQSSDGGNSKEEDDKAVKDGNKSSNSSGKDSDDKSDKNADGQSKDKQDDASKDKSKNKSSNQSKDGQNGDDKTSNSDSYHDATDSGPDRRKIEQMMKEQEELDKKANDFGEEEMNKPLKEEKESKDEHFNPDVKDIQALGEDGAEDGDFEIRYSNQIQKSYPVSDTVKIESKVLYKNLKPIFMSKPNFSYNRRKGMVDTRNLTKVALKDKDIFKKRNSNSKPDVAITILIDKSGSMSSKSKWRNAMETASIIELGIAELAPLKIMTFCTWSGTVIDVIKDFNDSSNLKGYVEHFQLMQGPTGGNRDGFAIRIAGAELAKRPEKTKILIVISDGQPSDYCRKYESGIEDVHNSILELNKRGIETFGIYIERDLGYMDRFRYMYGEKRSLVCSSNELPIILPRLIRQNLR